MRPSPAARVSYLIILFLAFSCGTLRIPGTKKNPQMFRGRVTGVTNKDYSDQLASLGKAFLSTPGIKVLTTPNADRYLRELTAEIISKNEIFFKNVRSARVTIIDTEAPLHFSLPKGELFLSRGLIQKYLKHESMLVGILAYELVRTENSLYPKKLIIPIGYLPLERMLGLSRLTLEEKIETDKWAHYLTVRSGYGGEYYLSWLQTQNRNTADFILQVGDVNLINREESLFKAFLIKNYTDNEVVGKKNSSKQFYAFLNSIRDQGL